VQRRFLPLLALAVATAAAGVALVAFGREDDGPRYPSSLAATGDSITSGFNTCPTPFADCPASSWATGTSPRSLYRRILAENPAIAERAYNVAVPGADVADLAGQMERAVARGVDLVTVLIGANDACAPSEAEMTSVAAFRERFRRALDVVAKGLPEATVLVASIPDLRRLWALYRGSLAANAVWAVADVCPTMLGAAYSDLPDDVARRVSAVSKTTSSSKRQRG
jgi:lysophospholipase L1-like esterase